MTDDVRYSDWVFSIQRIPNFHGVDATNLIETVTFRQRCCRPSSRHRSCFALRTFGMAFYPSDNTLSAAAISQGTTEFSNYWVPHRLTWALCSCRCCEGGGVSSSTSASAASSARSSSSAKSGSLYAAATKFPSGVTSSSSAVSRNLCAN